MGNLDFSANADQLKELAAYMASQINVPTIGIGGGYAPIGSINFFDATVAPQDWLACDGTVYNIADYPQLADWYEAQHGSKNFYGGDGTTTFAVPDLQGEFLRGTGANSHANQGSGANVGEHQDGTKIANILNADGYYYISQLANSNSENVDSYGAGIAATGRYQAQGNFERRTYDIPRPTNTSFLICVKAVVAGDVYSTEERVVGTWIDGKPLYQKTYDCGAGPNATTKSVPLDFTDYDHIYSIEGIIQATTVKSYSVIPMVHNTTMTRQLNVAIYNNAIQLQGGAFDFSQYDKIYITIQYTKTTD